MKKTWTLTETAGICGIRFLNEVALYELPEGLKKEVEACSKAITKEIPWDTWRERIDKHLGVPTDVLLALGFRPWNDGDPELWLIPFWLMPHIPDGFPVAAIDGEHLAWDKNRIDDDVRFGCLAYGIEVPKPAKGGAE